MWAWYAVSPPRGATGTSQPLTLLSDQLDLRNEPQITWRGHRVSEQRPTMADGALVPKEDWASSSKAHPVPTVSQHDLGIPWAT